MAILRTTLLMMLAISSVTAAQFWDTVPFMQWSDGQVRKVITESPWAVTLEATLPPKLNAPSGPARQQLYLLWSSALPVRQAIVRRQAGRGATPTAEQQELLKPSGAYFIVVDHLPFPFRQGQVEAFLIRKAKPPITAREFVADKTAQGFALQVGFPRTDPIVLHDDEVEFRFKAGSFGAGISFSRPFEFSRTFKLKNMTVNGRLEL
jgi:hypothetical protein